MGDLDERDALLPTSEAILEYLNVADDRADYDHEVMHVPTGGEHEILRRSRKDGSLADTRTFHRPDLRRLEDDAYVRRRGNRVSITPSGKQFVSQPR